MPADPAPTAADYEAARACWLAFAEFPTYIREEKAVQCIARVIATARAEAYKLGYFNGWHAGPSADYDDDIANARRPE